MTYSEPSTTASTNNRRNTLNSRQYHNRRAREDVTKAWIYNHDGMGTSPEATTALARMAALTGTETTAMTNFINRAVAEGLWDHIWDMWCPALNVTDYQKGWKVNAAAWWDTPTGTHTAGQGVTFTTAQKYRMGSAPSTWGLGNNIGMFCFIKNVTYGTETTESYFGADDVSGNEYNFRTSSGASGLSYCVPGTAGAAPRPAHTGYQGDDLIGVGASNDGTRIWQLNDGGDLEEVEGHTWGGLPTVAVQFNGRNNNGTHGIAQARTDSFWAVTYDLPPVMALTLRRLGLQLLRDLGVTGVPAT